MREKQEKGKFLTSDMPFDKILISEQQEKKLSAYLLTMFVLKPSPATYVRNKTWQGMLFGEIITDEDSRNSNKCFISQILQQFANCAKDYNCPFITELDVVLIFFVCSLLL